VADPISADSNSVELRVDPVSLSVIPGGSLTVPVTLSNEGWDDLHLEVAIPDLPTGWVSMPIASIRLTPGAQRQVGLVLRVPPPPDGRAGRYPLKLRVTSFGASDCLAEADIPVIVATFKMQGRVGILMEATEFAVSPGQTAAGSLIVLNQGLSEDDFILSVEGIPDTWISTPSPVTRVPPGGRKEVPLTIASPRLPESVAGVHPFALRVASHGDPDQTVKVDCTLAVSPFSRFASQLRPFQVANRGTAAITVQNRGNADAAFTVILASERKTVRFKPAETMEMQAAADETVRVEFAARVRRRPLFGGEARYPYTAQVQSQGAAPQVLEGEVVTQGLIPGWLVASVVILGLFFAFAYLYLTRRIFP
jgi:hypothetical protein